MKKLLQLLFAFSILFNISEAQPWFPDHNELYRTDEIPRVDITIHPDTLQWIYENVDSDYEFKAQFAFTIDGITDTVADIGFRLRGNTSRQSAKKSFKISFNTYVSGRKYKGVEKMNLNGEHNDPSVIRSYLSWNVFKELRVPGSRINHVDVYINDSYFGLYANVEHIDEEFIEKRFDNKFGNLYKCLYPANLSYLGSNQDDYVNNGYTLKINTDQFNYSDLIAFIQTLNNSSASQLPENIEPIFNVNGFLRYLAVEVFTSHWDGYSFNKNNYYLYNNKYTGKFEFIPYDVDNTYGIDWFIGDLANRDIYNWGPEWEPMVLTTKVLENQMYRDRYSFFMNQLVEVFGNTSNYFAQIDAKKEQINTSAENDPFRPLDYGWSFTDFTNSYTQALGDHVTYGLKPYITQRIASIQSQLDLNPVAPIIENVYRNYPALNETIHVKADIIDDEPNFMAKLYYKINDGPFQSVNMANEAEQVYNASIAGLTSSGTISYYIEATDASSNSTREPYSGNYTISIGGSNKHLVINEFMASNTNSVYDNYGETEDWIELKNKGTEAVELSGLYLSDDRNDKTKWKLPGVTIQPGGYYLIWADKDTEQGPDHTNFKLSSNGEFIGIFDSFENNYAAIDTIRYEAQPSDISMGIDSEGNMLEQTKITPKGENESADVAHITFNYNMNKQIADGNFIQNMDYIDIAGTFNGWSGSIKIYDGDNDGIHTATLFGFEAGAEIAYKARINADWSGGEFPELGGDGNRFYTPVSGGNILTHWFNDQATDIHEIDVYQSQFNLYPNPSTGMVFNISSGHPVSRVQIFTLAGKLVFTSECKNEKLIIVKHSLLPGMYVVQVSQGNVLNSRKLIIH